MIVCKTKQWGNSIGIILPKDIVRENNIKPGDEVLLAIENKRTVLKELFGALRFKKSTKTLIEESRKSLESRYN